ncbi:tyrosine-type recombinase/integrase [Alphaproteobacteria bacterium]|nr:tyrosine-type recombinase/integrase [Alphaproteobacteria bacterium]
MCAWRVDQMVDHFNVSYLYKKRGVFYFTKRVPCDVKSYYKNDRIVICLRTKSNVSAIRASKSLYQKLDDYWTSIRLTKMQFPAEHMLVSKPPVNSNSNAPLLSEALTTYLKLKGEGKDKTFIRGANRNIKYVIELLGDLPIYDYSSKDASKFRDYLLDRGLLISSVKRIFSSIRSIINLSITEEGINCINAFSKTYMPDKENLDIRKPIPTKDIKYIQSLCVEKDDDLRWLIALLSDTGMRLGEGVGLLKSDINIDCEIPHIKLVPHPWRRLKTRTSERCIPLVGASLWASRKILDNRNDSIYAFPRYTTKDNCNANSASAALNKWLKEQLTDNYVVHGFRHSFRDRLRASECPSEIIDKLGGWSLKSVGEGYGRGYELSVLSKWLLKI